MSSVPAAVKQLVHFDRWFEPSIEMRGYYDDKYGQYLALYEALRPFNAHYRSDWAVSV